MNKEQRKKAKERKNAETIRHEVSTWYSLDKINELDCVYNFLLGGRGVGKTYAVMKQAIKHRLRTGEPFAYIRRYKESIAPSKVQDLCKPHYELIEHMTNGEYNHVKVWQGCFWLEYRNEEGELIKKDPNPLGYLLSLSTQDVDKGADRGFVKYIIFDEVIARNGYLRDEWAVFQNCISTLVRHRAGTKIYLLANPISKFCLYFDELGIDFNAAEQGKIYVIKYDDEGSMKCAFEFIADSNAGSSAVADEYFAFKNSDKAKSITQGVWEFNPYEHLPSGIYQISEKIKEIYIRFTGLIFCAEIMKYKDTYFLFFRPAKEIPKKTYYLSVDRYFDKYAIVACNHDHPIYKLLNKIYKTGNVYYSTNQCGDYIDGFRAAAKNMRV